MARKFQGNFTQQEGMPQSAIDAAIELMKSGRLHRYNLAAGEEGAVAALEREYCEWQGSAYCLSVTSGGQAIQIALRACGVKVGDAVLTNSFTLAPVPGAIAAVGGNSVLVEIDDNLRIDLDDLENKISQSGAKFLLLSHMRGHLCDMERLMRICDSANVCVIEDCAHTMGARWNGARSGNFGKVGCFSTQTYKHMNSGEGGFFTTNDPEIAARATILSGSYMLFERHGAGPELSQYEQAKFEMPNCSARMDALRASLLRPQIKALEDNVERWNARYISVAEGLAKSGNRILLPDRPAAEEMVGSSIQFSIPSLTEEQCRAMLAAALERGVELKWFGGGEPTGFTSSHHSWHYMQAQQLPQTDHILATLFDMRLPLTFSIKDCELIAELIVETADEIIG